MTDFTSTARRRELGADLRRIRERSGINGNEMAAKLHWNASTLSRAETGKRPLKMIEIAAYLGLCGVAGPEMDRILDLAGEPDDHRIKQHLGKIPDELRSLMLAESTATEIDVFEPIFIPGTLQTPEYSRALFIDFGMLDPAKLDERVELRHARRAVLTRLNPARCSFYIHESALMLPVGGPVVMRDQLLHLLFTDSRPQCAVRVLPFAAGPRGTAPGSFHIFGYPEDFPLVFLEHENTSEFLESPDALKTYRELLDRLASAALDEAQSRAFIAWKASEFDQGAAEHAEVAQE